LFHRVKIRTKAAVHSQYPLVDNCDNRKAVEAIRECLPELDIVPSLTLVVEAIDAIDRGSLMIATQEKEILWVFNLVSKKKAYRLYRLLASIDIVSKEEVV
jgi:hypothetical protein